MEKLTGTFGYEGEEVRWWTFRFKGKVYMSFSNCSYFYNDEDENNVYPSNPLYSELSKILEYLKEDITEYLIGEND